MLVGFVLRRIAGYMHPMSELMVCLMCHVAEMAHLRNQKEKKEPSRHWVLDDEQSYLRETMTYRP